MFKLAEIQPQTASSLEHLPPFVYAVQNQHDVRRKVLDRVARPLAMTQARPEPSVFANSCLREVNAHFPLSRVTKRKRGPLHWQAGNFSADKGRLNISTFEVDGPSRFSGVLSPTMQTGSQCKIRVLLTWQNELFAVRQSTTRWQQGIKQRRIFADKTQDANKWMALLKPERYIQERRAQQLVGSSFLPLASFYDGPNERLWDVIKLMDGDLWSLSETFAASGFPRGLLHRVAQQGLGQIEQLERFGLQHNDVKPENFLWRRGGHVELADFGQVGVAIGKNDCGSDGYIGPERVLPPGGNQGGNDLYGLAMALIHLVDPYNFRQFPLAFHADRVPRDSPERGALLAQNARRARLAYRGWRDRYVEANNFRRRKPSPPSEGEGAAFNLDNMIERIECARQKMVHQGGKLLADQVFLFWAHEDPRQRGEAGSFLPMLQVAFPPGCADFQAADRALSEVVGSDAGCRRVDATILALQNFRAAYLLQVGAAKASA